MKKHASYSEVSENKRYYSVERPRYKLDNFSLTNFARKYSGSKYSLSHKSGNHSDSEQEESHKQNVNTKSSEPKVPQFELKNVKNDMMKSTESEDLQVQLLKSKVKPVIELPYEAKVSTQKAEEGKIGTLKLKIDPEIVQTKSPLNNNPKSEKKNYDDIIKESLDFATFLKNQETEISNMRESDLSDVLKVRQHVENLVRTSLDKSKAKQSDVGAKHLRQTLDFVLSESDDSLDPPDEQEIKRSIIKFERKSLANQSNELLKSMRDAIEQAKLCLSNNDFSNPALRKVQLYKREMAQREEDMENDFGHDLDELLDDDFITVTPSKYDTSEQNKQAVETLGDELNELYQNYGEHIFDYNEKHGNSSDDCTPRGYTLLPSVIDTKFESSKKVIGEDLGVYEGPEAQKRFNIEQESPFSLAFDANLADPKSKEKLKKGKSAQEEIINRDSEKFEKFEPQLTKINSEIVERRARKPKNQSKDYLTTNKIIHKQKSSEKRVVSAGNTPSKSHEKSKKKRIPANVKKKLRENTRSGSVMRKYSLDKFKETNSDKGAANSIERLRDNLKKFKENTIFRKGSESEKSLRSRDSKVSA